MAKNYELQIRKDLEDAGIFKDRINGQVTLTAMQLRILDRLVDEFDKSDTVDIEVSASGTEKKVINPSLPYIIKLMQQVQSGYEALGLNYNARPQNIKESVTSDNSGDDDSPLAALLKNMNDGEETSGD